MSENLQKNFAVRLDDEVAQKNAFHPNTFDQPLAAFSKTAADVPSDQCFLDEMSVHPALFLHPHPKRIAIIGKPNGVLQEVCKHTGLEQIVCVDVDNPTRVVTAAHAQPALIQYQSHRTFLTGEKAVFDVVIDVENRTHEHDAAYAMLLAANGFLIQRAPLLVSLSDEQLQALLRVKKMNGLDEVEFLNVLQLANAAGSSTLMLASKKPGLKRLRERDVFNRGFATRYYNVEIHKAAFALPEFIREKMG